MSCMAGSNLTTDNVGRNKIGKLLLFEIKEGWELAAGPVSIRSMPR